jgi:tetratricopeptide (TPR) repeat protein
MAVRDQVLGSEGTNNVASLMQIALIQKAKASLAEARATAERAVALDENFHGAESPETVPTMGYYAEFLEDMDDYTGAKAVLERALRIVQRSGVETWSNLAPKLLVKLGRIYVQEARLAEAEEALQRAIQICDKACAHQAPCSHQQIFAEALGTLGEVYLDRIPA